VECLLQAIKIKIYSPQPFPFFNILANIDLNLIAAMAISLPGRLPGRPKLNFLK